jgi:dGTPase
LNGILKYPWVRDKDCSRRNRKWGAYGTDRVFLDFAREGLEEGNDRKSLEAEIMDWADDITFAVHDLLDFYASGDIPIYFFLPDLRNLYKGIDMDERVKFIADIVADPHNYKLIENAQKLYDSTLDPKICLNGVLDGVFERHLSRLHSRYTGTDKQRGSISAIAFGMIEDCLQAFKLRVGEDDGLGPWRVWKDLRPEVEIDILKQFTWHYVIRGQQLQCEELGQQRAVRTVFDTFMNAARSNNGEDRYLFPWHMREQVHDERTSQDKTRRVVDYVASMSEPELMRIYRQLIADNGYRQ